MSGPGGQDAADRALDDALALANERRRPSAPGSAATRPDPHDPLSVALGHDEPPRAARPAEGPREPGAAADPLAVALGLGREDTGSDPVAEPPGRPGHSPAHAEDGIPWPEARKAARLAGRRLPARSTELGEGALGMALARALVALTDLPSFDTSAMDGWAVAGNGPWRLRGRLMAGHRSAEPLHDGHAVDIATGAALPPGATSVLRSEHGRIERRTDGEWLRLRPDRRAPEPGQEVRRRGQECRGGDELLPAGTVVTAAVLGLASAAGYDELAVTTRPRVEVLVLGDELLDHGLPRAGRLRDALGPMLPSWLRALGAEVTSVRRLADDEGQLYDAVAGSTAELVITTGGTAGGPRDHVHPVLARFGARLLVDGVAVRPGHPMLLARLPSGGHLIGLPGNPLAAVAGVLTLAAPLLRTLAGRPVPAPYAAPLTADVPGHPVDTRLVPVVFDDESAARPLDFAGPAMLRGLAAADGMAVIPPGGARAGDDTAVLDTGVLDSAWGSGG